MTSPNGAVGSEHDPFDDDFNDPLDTFFEDQAETPIYFPRPRQPHDRVKYPLDETSWKIANEVFDALEHGPDADRFRRFSKHGKEEMQRYPSEERAYIDFVKTVLPYTGDDFRLIDEIARRTFWVSTVTWAFKKIGPDFRPYREKVILLAAQEWYREYQAKTRTASNGAAAPARAAYPEPEDMGTAVASDLADVEYVGNLLKPGRLLVVGAVEGTGKTYTVSNELGIRFAWAGGDLAETWPMRERGHVLLLSEMHRDDDIAYEERVLAALSGTRANLSGRYFRLSLATAASGKPVLADEGWVNWLVDDFVPRQDIKLLIIDTVASAIEGEPWGENLIRIFRTLRAIVEVCPSLAIALVAHMKKPSGGGERDITDVIGQWTRHVDVVLLMTPQDEGRVRLRTLKRLREPVDIIATQSDGLLIEPFPVGAERGPKVELARVLDAVEARPDLTVAELAEVLEVSKKTAERYVEQGVKLGLLRRHRVGLNGPYRVRRA